MHSKKPLIGITLGQALKVNYKRQPMSSEYDYLARAYHYAVEKSGGSAIGLFNTDNRTMIRDYLNLVDGLIFTGGYDIAAKFFKQKHHPRSSKPRFVRDRFEISLIRNALKAKKSIFCICRGHQLLNVALGGNLYQDMSLVDFKPLRHYGGGMSKKINHPVLIKEDTLLFDILGKRKIICNSSHHQAINKLGKGLTVSATAPDEVIEGVEINGYPFLLSVQWHPEKILGRDHARRLFSAFISACS